MVSGYTPPAHHQSPRPFSSVKTTRGTEDSVDLQFSCFPIFLVSLLKISLLTCLLNYGISRLFLWILVTSSGS